CWGWGFGAGAGEWWSAWRACARSCSATRCVASCWRATPARARWKRWSASRGPAGCRSCEGPGRSDWATGSAGRRSRRAGEEAPAPPKRRRAVKAAAEPVAAAPEERPKRRRRTAAEVAVAEAEAQAEAAIEAERDLKAREALEAAKAVDDEEKPSLEERAAALFKELPAADETHREPLA